MPDFDIRARRRYRRRDAPSHLHRLPSAVGARGARRAGAAHDLRPHHRRDRARFPAAGGDRRAAHRAREAHAFAIGAGSTRHHAARSFRQRLASVLEVVYLIFNEGYTAARGADWLRPQLCHEALRLGRVLTAIAPHEPEAFGLLALMELNASRTAARTDAQGEPILLLEQNRGLWNQLQIRRGFLALGRARELGGAGGNYALQAAIVACHAGAATAGETDWSRIAALYAELAASHAFADRRTQSRGRRRHGRGSGARAGHRRSSSRRAGAEDLSPAAGRSRRLAAQARPLSRGAAAFEAAAVLTGNKREHDLLKRRAADAAGATRLSQV